MLIIIIIIISNCIEIYFIALFHESISYCIVSYLTVRTFPSLSFSFFVSKESSSVPIEGIGHLLFFLTTSYGVVEMLLELLLGAPGTHSRLSRKREIQLNLKLINTIELKFE